MPTWQRPSSESGPLPMPAFAESIGFQTLETF